MSYLMQHAVRRPTSAGRRRRRVRVDERILLNRPAFDGGAYVRVFVEDTSSRKLRRGRAPSPRLKLRVADCVNEVNLEFAVDSTAVRENSLFKIDTLLAALHRFRDALVAEADLYAAREREKLNNGKEVRDVLPEAHPPAPPAAVGADPRLGPGS